MGTLSGSAGARQILPVYLQKYVCHVSMTLLRGKAFVGGICSVHIDTAKCGSFIAWSELSEVERVCILRYLS